MAETNLILTVSSYQGDSSAGRAQKRFEQVGGSIGRDRVNDWVLPDPVLVLSRTHATISYKSGNYFLTDVSRNGVFVNDRLLGRGNQIKLTNDDLLRLGGYEVRVRLEPASAASPQMGAQTDPIGSQGADDFSHPGAAAGFQPLPPEMADGIASDEPNPGLVPPSASSAVNPILDQGVGNFSLPPDWFGAPEGHPQPAEVAGGATPDARLKPQHEALAGRISPPDASDIPASRWQFATAADEQGAADAPVRPARAKAPPPADVVQLDEWPTGFGAAEKPATPSPFPPDLSPMQEAGRSGPSSPASPPPARGVADHAPAGGMDAFLRGAGMLSEQIEEYDERSLERAGLLFRRLIQGTMEILAVRTRVKQEFHLAQTSIQARGNNPLKFLPTTEDVIRELLSPQQQDGYQSPVESIDEAFADIEAHQIATFAGIQAAFRGMFARFNPASLEDEFSRHAGIGALIPMRKKAKCWDLFAERFDSLVREAEEDFQRLFGNEFASAYQQQAGRLKRLQHPDGVPMP